MSFIIFTKTINVRGVIINDTSVSSRRDKTEWKIMKRERCINEAGPDETNAFLLRGNYSKYNET